MNSDVGLIDQQLDSVGIIPRRNLRTFNPSLESEKIYSKKNTEMYGFIDLQNNRVGVIPAENMEFFNPPQGTLCKKIVMAENYYIMDYNDKTMPYFHENQKIPSISSTSQAGVYK